MIYHKNREILLNHEDSEVFAGIHLGKFYYVANRYMNLGEGREWYISTLYPNLFADLTADNFFIINAKNVSGGETVVNSTPEESGRVSISVGLTKTYDSNTGKLTMNVYCNKGKGDVTAVLISKPEKLKPLGTAQTFDVASMFPTTYGRYTADNFLIKSYNGGLVHNDFRGVVGTWTASCTQSLFKEYNAQTGVLTCYMNERVVDNYTGTKTFNRDCEVYLYQGKAS